MFEKPEKEARIALQVAMDLDLRFSESVIIFTDTPNPVHLDAA